MINIPIRVDALHPEEFEKFAVDIARIKYNNLEIQTFAQGRDDGIDGADNTLNPSIVLQAKRWNPRMSISSAVSEIKKEISKIIDTVKKFKWKNKFKYVVFTTLELSPNRNNEILNYAKQFDIDFELVDGSTLDVLSRNDKYKDVFINFNLIYKPLFQLLRDDRLQNSLDLESEEFLKGSSLLFNLKYFVETTPFFKAVTSLKQKRMLILHGNPGVGKSTMCAMLGNIMSNNFETQVSVIKRSIDEIQDVRELYYKNFENKEKALLIIFDDFLGQNSLEVEDRYFNKIIDLFNMVNATENFYVILNSRTQILNTATNSNTSFSRFIEFLEGNKSKILIDSSELSLEDKGKIFRKIFEHQYIKLEHENIKIANSLSDKYLTLNNNFKRVISNENFNPRLIELIATHFDESNNNFVNFILETFKKPTYLYDEIFDKLKIEEKYLLFVIFLYEDNEIEVSKLRNIMVSLPIRKDFSVDTTIENLNESWLKLSLVVTKNENIEKRVNFVNPSIKDYLKSKITTLKGMKKEILNNAVYFDLLLINQDENDFLKSVLKKWDFNQEQKNYIGERIVSLIKLQKSSDYFEEVSNYLVQYEGVWHSKVKHRIIENKRGWVKLLKAISNSNDTKLKNWFIDKFIIEEDTTLFRHMLYTEKYNLGFENQIIMFSLIDDMLQTSKGINFRDNLENTSERLSIETKYTLFCEWIEEAIQDWIYGLNGDDINEIIDLESDELYTIYDDFLIDSAIEKFSDYIYSKLLEVKLEDKIDLGSLYYGYVADDIENYFNELNMDTDDEFERWRENELMNNDMLSDFATQPLSVEM